MKKERIKKLEREAEKLRADLNSVSAEVIRYKNEVRAIKGNLDSLLFKIEKAGIKASFSENRM